MFCKRCGNKLGTGEQYCPECGAPVCETKAAAAPTVRKVKKKRFCIPLIITSALMFISTFLPFIDLSLSKPAKMAMNLLDEYLPDDLSEAIQEVLPEYLRDLKQNCYGLIGTCVTQYPKYRLLLLGALLIVVTTIILGLVTGFRRNKSMLVIVGILSAICFMLAIACLIIIGRYVDAINSEIQYYFGDFGEVVGAAIKVNNSKAIGLTLFALIAAVQSIVAFFGAARK